MLTTKVVVRVLDADGALLGWADVQAEARGDGCLWRPTPRTTIVAVRSGRAAELSYHMADLNIESRVRIDARVMAGNEIVIDANPIVKLGDMPARPLPPVTVGSSVVRLPVGTLGATP